MTASVILQPQQQYFDHLLRFSFTLFPPLNAICGIRISFLAKSNNLLYGPAVAKKDFRSPDPLFEMCFNNTPLPSISQKNCPKECGKRASSFYRQCVSSWSVMCAMVGLTCLHCAPASRVVCSSRSTCAELQDLLEHQLLDTSAAISGKSKSRSSDLCLAVNLPWNFLALPFPRAYLLQTSTLRESCKESATSSWRSMSPTCLFHS